MTLEIDSFLSGIDLVPEDDALTEGHDVLDARVVGVMDSWDADGEILPEGDSGSFPSILSVP